MPQQRRAEPDTRVVDAAKKLAVGVIKDSIQAAAPALAEELGTTPTLAAAALASVLENGGLRAVAGSLVVEAERTARSAHAARLELEPLVGMSFQGVDRRYKESRSN